MGYIGRYTAPSIVDLESPVSVDGTTIIENGVLKNVGIDGIKLKSSGNSITKSDGTTAVLSESGGTVTFAADGLAVNGTSLLDGAVVINESGADVDFRIESDPNTHAFFLEGSSGNVGIGTIAPNEKLQVSNGGIAINPVNPYGGLSTRTWKSDYTGSAGSQNLLKIVTNTGPYALHGGPVKIRTAYAYRGGFTTSNYAEYIVMPRQGAVPVVETIYTSGTVPTISVSLSGTETTISVNFVGDSHTWVVVESGSQPVEWYI